MNIINDINVKIAVYFPLTIITQIKLSAFPHEIEVENIRFKIVTIHV